MYETCVLIGSGVLSGRYIIAVTGIIVYKNLYPSYTDIYTPNTQKGKYGLFLFFKCNVS
jgi:hypothetical protein